MSMIGAEGKRFFASFGLLQAILDKTAFKMAERAQLGQGNSQKFTPFAASAQKLSIFRPARQPDWKRQLHRAPARQQLREPSAPGVQRPGQMLEKSDEVMNSIDTAYLLENYRSIYEDPRFEVQLPVPEELTADTSMLPPLWVEGQAGRPSNASKASKGPARTKRIPSIGEKNASSSFNVRLPPS
ncbi:unnamed protein product, partial [Ascophyllum nodosum]